MTEKINQPEQEDRSFLAGLRAPLHHKELFVRNIVALTILTMLMSLCLTIFSLMQFWNWTYPRNMTGWNAVFSLCWCVSMFITLFIGRAKARKAEKEFEAIKDKWPFPDANNATVITSKKIAAGKDWIYCVCHDAANEEWQFHPYSGYVIDKEASTVAFDKIAKQDPSILELHDLPTGWHAWRDKREEKWQRAPQNQSDISLAK